MHVVLTYYYPQRCALALHGSVLLTLKSMLSMVCAASHVNAVQAGPGNMPCSQVWYSVLRKTNGAEPKRQSSPGAAGQNVSHIDSLFTGGQMGLQSDIADGRYCHPFRRSGAAVTDVFSRSLFRPGGCAVLSFVQQ